MRAGIRRIKVVETLGEIAMAAQRNRMLKRALSAHFGKGKVRVRGHSGTATIKIDATPPSIENRRGLERIGVRLTFTSQGAQRLGRVSITRGNVGSSRTAANRIGETVPTGWMQDSNWQMSKPAIC
jgi:hypothetical protein